MTTDTLGDVWSYSLNLARALAPFNVHIHLASMGAIPDEYQKEETEKLSNVTLYSSNWQLEWMDDPWDEVEAAGHWLKYLQSEIRPDLMHFNHYSLAALPWKSPVLLMGHGSLLSWWEVVKGAPAPSAYNTYRSKVRSGLQAANMVVASTASALAELVYHYGPLAQQQLIHNSIVSPQASLPAKQPFVLTKGNLWDETDNIAFCETLAAEGLSWPLLVIGEEKAQGGQQAFFPNLHRLGKLSRQDMADRMAVAAVYLHPVKYDPFGLTVLEAAHAGCALVLADIPALRELWQDAALFISVSDVAVAHEQVEALLQNKKQRQLLAQKAKVRAQQYNAATQGRHYFSLYQQLNLEGKQQAAPASSKVKNNSHKQ
ncbi:MAG: glycosyltransferase family 4 protein [Bacteroidetes bacterium]|nr:glycosyltransferase family 4 protein [Bacteroidota bacterium]